MWLEIEECFTWDAVRTITVSSLDTVGLDLENWTTTYWDICPEEDIRLIDTEVDPLRPLLDSTDAIDRDTHMISEEREEGEWCFYILTIHDDGQFLNHICMVVYPRPYKCCITPDTENSGIIGWLRWYDKVPEFQPLRNGDRQIWKCSIVENYRIFGDRQCRCREGIDEHVDEYRERDEKDKMISRILLIIIEIGVITYSERS